MSIFFFFNDTATTEIYTLSLHDALPISFPGIPFFAWWRAQPVAGECEGFAKNWQRGVTRVNVPVETQVGTRSEEHTSELQSHSDLVCRLLLEKKKIVPATSSSQTVHSER